MTDRPHRLTSVTLDDAALPAATAEIAHARDVAIHDLVKDNRFEPAGAPGGPYALRISLLDQKLALELETDDWRHGVLLSLTPFRSLLRDYRMICESYVEALRGVSASQIEAVDMGRRGLHNDGADLIRARLDGKIAMDHETARRLFTLLSALTRKA